IRKASLYEGVRKVFAEQTAQSVVALNGEQITLTLDSDAIAVSSVAGDGTTSTAHSLSLMLLSPDVDVRQDALQRTVAELGPTGPDSSYWGQELQRGALDDDGMDRFSDH